MDTELDRVHLEDTPGGPRSAKKGVFGSLERLITMLTPKKRQGSSGEAPRKVKVSFE